jgi:hypothetical protein
MGSTFLNEISPVSKKPKFCGGKSVAFNFSKVILIVIAQKAAHNLTTLPKYPPH